ncbi:hypothetical protein CDL15_Pgr011264 [Punica granatum]|uniref:GTP-binding protein SAR1A-like n=1 Tax=Punica granatum TaxID=22663 RepID=A0A218WE69_PUNGR|nr:hypothetical protein CDL15_Pgr011264 [Punica granatum]
MFLVDWFRGILASLAVWRKEAKILFLGLDNGGKTTLLRMLTDESLGQYQRTQHPTSEELSIGNIKFKAFDLGGHAIARRVWKDYYAQAIIHLPICSHESFLSLMSAIKCSRFPLYQSLMSCMVHAVVYLVDSCDRERFAEAKKELDALLSDDSLTNVPFLILGNKIDILNAASENELRYFLGLADSTTGKGQVNLEGTNVRPLEVFMCSIVRKMGYGEGFQWLCQYIK